MTSRSLARAPANVLPLGLVPFGKLPFGLREPPCDLNQGADRLGTVGRSLSPLFKRGSEAVLYIGDPTSQNRELLSKGTPFRCEDFAR